MIHQSLRGNTFALLVNPQLTALPVLLMRVFPSSRHALLAVTQLAFPSVIIAALTLFTASLILSVTSLPEQDNLRAFCLSLVLSEPSLLKPA